MGEDLNSEKEVERDRVRRTRSQEADTNIG